MSAIYNKYLRRTYVIDIHHVDILIIHLHNGHLMN
jgi:hypothetical protein